jgi:NADPH:quinone reductase-like Zn-dependent oxidoreductase
LGNLSTGIDIPGHQAPGAYARHLVRDQDLWFPLPDGVDAEQAAVILWPYSTSHRVLTSRLRAALGDTLLICGASGAMGLATLRLAKLMGLRVLVVTRHDAKADGLRSAGADHVTILPDTTPDRIDAAVRELRECTGGEGVDHAVDYSGTAVMLRLLVDTLRLGGHLCSAGSLSDPLPVTGADLTRLEATVVGVRGAQRRDALTVLGLLARGVLDTPIAARFPLARAADAHRFLENNTDLVGRVTLHTPAVSDRSPQKGQTMNGGAAS